MRTMTLIAIFVLACAVTLPGGAADRPRLAKEEPAGRREKLSLGTLFLPASLPTTGKVPLFLHFHAGGWIAEIAAARAGDLAVIHAHLGSGSAVYGKPFAGPNRLKELLAEAEKKSGREFELVGLTGWSAGYGAVRAILCVEEYYKQVRWVVLMDGLHAGYDEAKNPLKKDLDCYLKLAKGAASGEKRFLVTHSKIVPGTYASTTETADALLAEVGGKRGKPLTEVGLPVETEYLAGGLTILGCNGDTAPDHVDHLHVMPKLVALAGAGFTDAVIVDDVPLLHTTQLAPDPRKDGVTAKAQVGVVFHQLRQHLKHGDSSMSRVVRLNVYAASDAVVPIVERAMTEQFRGVRPTLSVVVGTPVADGVHVSLDAVATTSFAKAEPGPPTRLWPLEDAILPAGPVYYISGQAERGKSVAEAARKTLASLDATLKFLGRSPKDVVQVKSFLHPMKEIDNVREEIVAYFAKSDPPMTFVEWTSKDSIEIELVVAGAPTKEKPKDAVEYLTPPGMTASPVFSRVTRINHGKRIYTSGLTGSGKDAAAEVKDVFGQLDRVLKRHGSDMKHLAKATYYVSTDDASKQLNLLRPDYYDPKRPPAASKAPVRGTGRKGSGLILDMIAVAP